MRKESATHSGIQSLKRLPVLLAGNALVRIAGSAGGILIGLHFAGEVNQGRPVNETVVGALGAVWYAAELIAAIPIGILVDTLSPRLLMVLGSVVGALGVGALGVSRAIPVFFAARTMEGGTGATTAAPVLAYLTDVTEGARHIRGRVMSFFELTLLAGIALGGPIGSYLWSVLGGRAFFAVSAIYLISSVLFFAGTTTIKSKYRPPGLEGIRTALGERSIRRLAPAWLAINAIVGLWLGPMLTFLLTRRSDDGDYLNGLFADNPTDVGWVFLVYSIIFGTGVILWSLIIDGMPRKRVLFVSLTGLFVACAGLFLLNRSSAWTEEGRLSLMAGIAIAVMIESGFTPAALALLADRSGSGRNRGAVMGIYSALFGIGALMGAIIAGILGPRLGIDGLIYGTAGLAAIAMVAISRLDVPDTAHNG